MTVAVRWLQGQSRALAVLHDQDALPRSLPIYTSRAEWGAVLVVVVLMFLLIVLDLEPRVLMYARQAFCY